MRAATFVRDFGRDTRLDAGHGRRDVARVCKVARNPARSDERGFRAAERGMTTAALCAIGPLLSRSRT